MHDESLAKPEDVTRTKAEARRRAQEVLLKIRGGAPFEEMVKEYTDEPGGAVLAFVLDALKDQSADHAPMLVFAVVGCCWSASW